MTIGQLNKKIEKLLDKYKLRKVNSVVQKDALLNKQYGIGLVYRKNNRKDGKNITNTVKESFKKLEEFCKKYKYVYVAKGLDSTLSPNNGNPGGRGPNDKVMLLTALMYFGGERDGK